MDAVESAVRHYHYDVTVFESRGHVFDNLPRTGQLHCSLPLPPQGFHQRGQVEPVLGPQSVFAMNGGEQDLICSLKGPLQLLLKIFRRRVFERGSRTAHTRPFG